MIQFIPILINSSRASRIHVLLCIWHCNLEFREKITLVFQSRPMGQVLQNRDISSLLLTTSQVGMLEPVGDGFLPSRSSSRQSSVSAKLYESDTGKKSAPESHGQYRALGRQADKFAGAECNDRKDRSCAHRNKREPVRRANRLERHRVVRLYGRAHRSGARWRALHWARIDDRGHHGTLLARNQTRRNFRETDRRAITGQLAKTVRISCIFCYSEP